MPTYSSNTSSLERASDEEYSSPGSRSIEALGNERVIIAHGWLGRPGELSMLGSALAAAGFAVEYVKLDFLFGRFDVAVATTLKQIFSAPGCPAHLIGFSLGGLVMRAVAAASPSQTSSLLLIATPNAGSEFADLLARVFPTPAVRRLRRAAPRLPDPPQGVRIGCIAGTRRGFLGSFLPARNDSRVTVTSAFDVRHEYEALVHCKHEALRRHPDVLRHAVAFVRGEAE